MIGGKRITVKLIAITTDETVKTTASCCALGRIIASSYLPFEIEPNIVVSEINIAITPKSEGVYIRDNIGTTRIGMILAKEVPIIKVLICRRNLFFVVANSLP